MPDLIDDMYDPNSNFENSGGILGAIFGKKDKNKDKDDDDKEEK